MATIPAEMPVRTWFCSRFPLSMVGIRVPADGLMVVLSFDSVRVPVRPFVVRTGLSDGHPGRSSIRPDQFAIRSVLSQRAGPSAVQHYAVDMGMPSETLVERHKADSDDALRAGTRPAHRGDDEAREFPRASRT